MHFGGHSQKCITGSSPGAFATGPIRVFLLLNLLIKGKVAADL